MTNFARFCPWRGSGGYSCEGWVEPKVIPSLKIISLSLPGNSYGLKTQTPKVSDVWKQCSTSSVNPTIKLKTLLLIRKVWKNIFPDYYYSGFITKTNNSSFLLKIFVNWKPIIKIINMFGEAFDSPFDWMPFPSNNSVFVFLILFAPNDKPIRFDIYTVSDSQLKCSNSKL